MSYPVSHKTVFVLDHGPHFLDSCKQYIEYDIFTKSRQPAFIPLPQIAKSLWTCSAEAAAEYCRIVWDIYPRDKLIRFILSDSTAHVLNSWNPEEQNLNQILNGLARCGPPTNTRKESNILNGLNTAIECLCECSRIQHAKRTSLTENASRVWNKGRVVCITALKNEKHLKNVEEYFHDALIQHNKLAASSDNLMPIHFCELVILHVFPVGDEPTINTIPRREISPIFSSEVHSIKSGRHVALKLCHLVLKHYDLSSTTVTGIPMKVGIFGFEEEQNANSSANYDVELLHSSEAHSELIKTGYMNTEGVHIKTVKEGAEYETVTLKWCTPRTSGVEMQYCTGMYRITPIDVNSRPSSCLTNFLLNGRAVMLEMPRKSGSKVMSHTLTSHGDELFIHSLGTTRSILEDPPSISEGSGGRVTDYRIQDFGDFMKENRLAPFKSLASPNDLPIDKAKKQLERMTRYWPMVISNTTIFNMQHHMEPLVSIIRKERLDDAQVVECKKVIYQLVGMESRSEGLPIPTMGSRGKGPKREEQYRAMWNELETLIRVHCTTENHGKVLECVQECRKPTGEETIKNKKSVEENKVVKKKEENDVVWKERDKEREVKGNEQPPTKKLRVNSDDRSSGPVNITTLWANRVNSENLRRRPEFAGRLKAENNITVLYANLAETLDGKEVPTQIRE